MKDEYDVSQYTEQELYTILDLNNPSDRELEAKILSYVRKYSNFGNASGDKLAQFFINIYKRFFEEEEEEHENVEEGFITIDGNNWKTNTTPSGNVRAETGIYDSGVIGNAISSSAQRIDNLTAPSAANGVIGTTNVGNVVTPASDNIQLTKPLDYSKDKLNPLLKQTIKRIISIDSQYRDQKRITPTTNFTFNLSEPLKDVVSLSLYSIQIPYTWYTVNSNFGGNFFYLKGSSPGIDNGNHDYKIEVPSGNYTPDGLVVAVNSAIKTMISQNTDVSFGTTQAIYNNGITSTTSGTGKAQLQIDITKVFNEQNYYLEFPNWSSTVNDTTRLNTLSSYLGFNDARHYCSTIYSDFISMKTNDNATLLPTITTNINSFRIVPYVGNSYNTRTSTYDSITITLDLNYGMQYTRRAAVDNLNLKFLTTTLLDTNFSNCLWVDVSNAEQFGNQKSYIELNCKLNKYTFPKVPNLKLAAIFTYDPSGSIFYGPNSVFRFPTFDKEDETQNVICEFNDLYADTNILQTNYIVSGTNINFICNADGYRDTSLNNYTIPILDSTGGGYKLNSYLNAINTAFLISPHVGIGKPISSSTGIEYSNTDSYLRFKVSINNSFTNEKYSVKSSGIIADIFGLTSTPTQIRTYPNNRYFNSTYSYQSIQFDANDKLIISPYGYYGNQNASNFVISFESNKAFSSNAELASHLNDSIVYYTDLNGRTPFVNSSVEYILSEGFVLTLSVNIQLTQNDYNMRLDSSNNSWTSDLSFNTIYSLNTAYDPTTGFSIVQNNAPIKTNQITIYEGSNNYFYITPDSRIDGLQTSRPADQYKIKITIPDTSQGVGGTQYSIVELINAINAEFAKNPLCSKTTIQTVQLTNGLLYTKFRFDVNKVFGTSDYRLVFYDPISFVTCFSGASRKGSNSIHNATWDSTLGWLLGYRELIEYHLSEYTNIKYEIGTTELIYYLTSNPNICVLFGDTAVSTNLYNYFLIMLDDYVQNHLNDGLVTISSQETSVSHEPAVYVCDPVTGAQVARPVDYNTGNYTAAQLYAFNQQVQSQNIQAKSYSTGPFVQDIFGIVPVKTSGAAIGSVYVEFGGTLQNQQRLYFGPVNIHRMTIKLLTDRGDLVDLNGANWSFSLICEQLYKSDVK